MARLKKFDQKFGDDFIRQLPTLPGVYLIRDHSDELIYVGKAKNLKRRLAQYRNAKRCKKHHKMRAIVSDAASVEHRVCSSELDALLLETQLIQEHRPRWNVAGAFFFLYPMVGIREDHLGIWFCYTAEPEKYSEFQFSGAFRSRLITGEAFFSLMKLLPYIGHRITAPVKSGNRSGYVFGFRRIPKNWIALLESFWRGNSKAALETLALELVENAAARRKAAEVQELLNHLVRFWKHEALPLARAMSQDGRVGYPVPQRERDILFLKARSQRF